MGCLRCFLGIPPPYLTFPFPPPTLVTNPQQLYHPVLFPYPSTVLIFSAKPAPPPPPLSPITALLHTHDLPPHTDTQTLPPSLCFTPYPRSCCPLFPGNASTLGWLDHHRYHKARQVGSIHKTAGTLGTPTTTEMIHKALYPTPPHTRPPLCPGSFFEFQERVKGALLQRTFW